VRQQMERTDSNKAVIFDLDGVLVDTSEFHMRSWFDLAEKEGFAISEDFFYHTFGMQNYQIIPLLAKRQVSSDEIERMAQWKEQRYRELIRGKAALADGAQELLEDLKKAGFLMAVGTSTPKENVDLVMEETKAAEYFGAFVTDKDVRRGKPAPDTFLTAATKLKVPPERCVVVEDAVHGVEAARAAGMAVVAVTTTRKRQELAEADMVVDNLGQLNAEDFARLLK